MQNVQYDYRAGRVQAAPTHEERGDGSPFVHMHLLYRVAVICMYIVVMLTIVINVEVSAKSPVFTILCLSLIVNFTVVLLPVIFYRPQYGWFHPLVYVSLGYLIFHARSFATYMTGIAKQNALPTWSVDDITMLISYALTLNAAAVLSYYFGFFYGPDFRAPRLSFMQPRRFEIKAVVAVGMALAVFLVYMSSQGGLSSHILTWQTGRHEALKGDGYWHFVVRFAGVACLLWFAVRPRALLRPLFWVCGLVSIAMSFISTGSRSEIVFYVVVGALVWMLRERKFSLSKVVMVGLLGVILIGALGSYRAQVWQGQIEIGAGTNETSMLDTIWSGALEASDRAWGSNGTLPILGRVPDEVGLLYGESYAAVLTLPIPRDLWPGKPNSIGGMVGQTFYGTYAGVPPGAVGEAYWNFHIPGIIVVFFLFGTFHKWAMRVYLRHATRPAMVVLYLTVLFVIEPTTPAIVTGLLLIVPELVLMRLSGLLKFGRAAA